MAENYSIIENRFLEEKYPIHYKRQGTFYLNIYIQRNINSMVDYQSILRQNK